MKYLLFYLLGMWLFGLVTYETNDAGIDDQYYLFWKVATVCYPVTIVAGIWFLCVAGAEILFDANIKYVYAPLSSRLRVVAWKKKNYKAYKEEQKRSRL
jgi:hypothetical protein